MENLVAQEVTASLLAEKANPVNYCEGIIRLVVRGNFLEALDCLNKNELFNASVKHSKVVRELLRDLHQVNTRSASESLGEDCDPVRALIL